MRIVILIKASRQEIDCFRTLDREDQVPNQEMPFACGVCCILNKDTFEEALEKPFSSLKARLGIRSLLESSEIRADDRLVITQSLGVGYLCYFRSDVS